MFSLWKSARRMKLRFVYASKAAFVSRRSLARRRVYPLDWRVKTASSMSALLKTDYSPQHRHLDAKPYFAKDPYYLEVLLKRRKHLERKLIRSRAVRPQDLNH